MLQCLKQLTGKRLYNVKHLIDKKFLLARVVDY